MTGDAVRSVIVLVTVGFLGVSAGVGAQAARPAPATAPEVFSATAQAKNGSSAITGTLEVRVSRYTPDFDRKTVEEALRLGGYPRFLTALRNAPQVGQLTLADGEPFIIRYAREKAEGAGRTLVLVTDKPVFFVGSSRADAKPRAGYEIAVLRLEVDAAGRGRGSMASAARVRPDGDGGVLLDDYAEALIAVTDVMRRPADQ